MRRFRRLRRFPRRISWWCNYIYRFLKLNKFILFILQIHIPWALFIILSMTAFVTSELKLVTCFSIVSFNSASVWGFSWHTLSFNNPWGKSGGVKYLEIELAVQHSKPKTFPLNFFHTYVTCMKQISLSEYSVNWLKKQGRVRNLIDKTSTRASNSHDTV